MPLHESSFIFPEFQFQAIVSDTDGFLYTFPRAAIEWYNKQRYTIL